MKKMSIGELKKRLSLVADFWPLEMLKPFDVEGPGCAFQIALETQLCALGSYLPLVKRLSGDKAAAVIQAVDSLDRPALLRAIAAL